MESGGNGERKYWRKEEINRENRLRREDKRKNEMDRKRWRKEEMKKRIYGN